MRADVRTRPFRYALRVRLDTTDRALERAVAVTHQMRLVVVLVVRLGRHESYAAELARPAGDGVQLHVRGEVVAVVRVERALPARLERHAVPLSHVREQLVAALRDVSAHLADEARRRRAAGRAQPLVHSKPIDVRARKVAVLAEQLAMAAHVGDEAVGAVRGVATDGAVVLLADGMDVGDVPAQVPDVACSVAAAQAAERPERIQLKLHVLALDVTEEIAYTRLGVRRRWRRRQQSLMTGSRRLEFTYHARLVFDVGVACGEMLADSFAACKLLQADEALIWFRLRVHAGTVAPKVVHALCGVRAVLALVNLTLVLRR